MTFDPSVYEAKRDFQTEPNLSDEEWLRRFIASLVSQGMESAEEKFKAELPHYAEQVAPSYLADRAHYTTPEEAAWTDISYWEDEE